MEMAFKNSRIEIFYSSFFGRQRTQSTVRYRTVPYGKRVKVFYRYGTGTVLINAISKICLPESINKKKRRLVLKKQKK